MARNDDTFTPRPGRIRSSGGAPTKSYISRVLHAMEASRAGRAGPANSRGFKGTRIGRGNEMMRRYRAGYQTAPTYRRVIIRSRIVKLAGRGLGPARSHLKYIKRDGVSEEHEKGRLYDANSDDADGRAFVERSDGDRHQFRIMVSPEDGMDLEDLKPFVRDLVSTMESDLGTSLDWVAANHFNTGHPHTHIVIRGRDDQGKDLIIAREYTAHGIRTRASELLSLELGPVTEVELRRKLLSAVEQERFTRLDKHLLHDIDDNGVLDIRGGRNPTEQQYKHTERIARLRVLEKRGLAEEFAPGRWHLSSSLEQSLEQAGERRDIIRTMHEGLERAGLKAWPAELSIFNGGNPRARPITGQVIDRGLSDGLNAQPHITVDAADGRVHFVALGSHKELDELPLGAIVEVHPTQSDMIAINRTVAEIAQQHGGNYSTDLHQQHDRMVSDDATGAHLRRLELLRRQGVIERSPDGDWEIPDDFPERAADATRRIRLPGKALTLSYLSLEAQLGADGATWLDRQLLDDDPVDLRGARFSNAARSAMLQRQEHLIEQGLAEREEEGVRYRRNLLNLLRYRDVVSAGKRLATETGLSFTTPVDGIQVEGVYRRSVHLSSGKFAVLEKSFEFTLVPWRPDLERQRGRTISAMVRGSRMTFEVQRGRGIGLG